MRLLALVYERDAGPGVFAEAVVAAGDRLDLWHVAEGGAAPAEPASYDAVIALGGAMHVDQLDRHPWLTAEAELLGDLLERGVPLLGVCLGAQLLAQAAGGAARRASEPEIGWLEVEVTDEGADDPLLGPLAPRFRAFAWHSYECVLPPDTTVLARSPVCAHAFRVGAAAWGIQFHAEVEWADLQSWIDDYGSDPDDLRAGLDPRSLREASAQRIDGWNRLGRELCARFLAVARDLRAAGAVTPRPGPRG